MPVADSSRSSKRPIVAIVIAAILMWLAVGGLGNAFVWKAVPRELPAQMPAKYLPVFEALASSTFTALSLLYAVTAFVAAIGIWSLKRWKGHAFLLWSVAVLAVGVWMSVVSSNLLPGGVFSIAFFLIPTAALLAVGYWLVARLPVLPDPSA